MTTLIGAYRLIEYGSDAECLEVTKDLGARSLPCLCAFGFVVDYTGTPTDRDTVRIEGRDTAENRLFSQDFTIHAAHAGRAEFRLDPVLLSNAGIYTVRAWWDGFLVFTHRLTLAQASPP